LVSRSTIQSLSPKQKLRGERQIAILLKGNLCPDKRMRGNLLPRKKRIVSSDLVNLLVACISETAAHLLFSWRKATNRVSEVFPEADTSKILNTIVPVFLKNLPSQPNLAMQLPLQMYQSAGFFGSGVIWSILFCQGAVDSENFEGECYDTSLGIITSKRMLQRSLALF